MEEEFREIAAVVEDCGGQGPRVADIPSDLRTKC